MSEPYLEAIEEIKRRQKEIENQLKKERKAFESYGGGSQEPMEDLL